MTDMIEAAEREELAKSIMHGPDGGKPVGMLVEYSDGTSRKYRGTEVSALCAGTSPVVSDEWRNLETAAWHLDQANKPALAEQVRKAQAALSVQAQGVTDDPDKAYELGKEDGYSEGIADAARAVNIDPEYRWSEHEDRHQPDAAALLQRIEDEVSGLRSALTQSGRGVPEDPDELAMRLGEQLVTAVAATDDKFFSEPVGDGWIVNVSRPEVYQVNHEPERPDDGNE